MDNDFLMFSKSLDDSLDLLGELSGWGENQSLGVTDLGIDPFKDSDCEGTCFTST